MPSQLEIQYLSGESETHPLRKDEPVSIGKNFSNDICIDEGGVEAVHCRIAWRSSAFEASAVGDGIEVNGKMMKAKRLESGDIISIGSVDIAVQFEGANEPKAALAPDPELAPEAVLVAQVLDDEDAEEPPELQAAPEPPRRRRSLEDRSRAEDFDQGGDAADPKPAEEEKAESSLDHLSPLERMKAMGDRHDMRSGERSAIKSPLVLGLGGGAFVILLLAGIFYFMIDRESARRLKEEAEKYLQEGKFSQAIQIYDRYLKEFPNDAEAPEIELERGKTKIRQHVSGATPDWSKALLELKAFLRDMREVEGFKEQGEDLKELARQIALGAAEQAEKRKDKTLKKHSEEGEAQYISMFARFSKEEKPPAAVLAQITEAQNKAQEQIDFKDDYDGTLADVESLIKPTPPATVKALAKRAALLNRYSSSNALRTKYGDLLRDGGFRKMTESIRKRAAEAVIVEAINQAAQTQDHPAPSGVGPTLAVHLKGIPGDASDGRVMPCLAADACFGVDSVTSKPVWHRAIGRATPFAPIAQRTREEVLLMFDSYRSELILLARKTGNLVWRQAIEGTVVGEPLIEQGQIYLLARLTGADLKSPDDDGGILYKISLDTGRISSTLNFSQPLLSTPVLVGAEGSRHIVVFGENTLAYAISIAPLKCVDVSEIGHSRGSLRAAPLKLGDFVLICTLDGKQSTTLRALEIDPNTKRIVERDKAIIGGRVYHTPALRGSDLLVAAHPESLWAFTINQGAGEKVLSKNGVWQAEKPSSVQLYVSPEPGEILGLASSALQRFQLSKGAVTPSGFFVEPGHYTAAPKRLGDAVYTSRIIPYGNAVQFSRMNQEDLFDKSRKDAVQRNQARLGLTPLAISTGEDGKLLIATDSGFVFDLTAAQLKKGDIVATPLAGVHYGSLKLLPNDDKLINLVLDRPAPIQAKTLSDGRLVMWTDKRARVWVFDKKGKDIVNELIPAPLDAPPVLLDDGLVLPTRGSLQMIGVGKRIVVTPYQPGVGGGEQIRWVQVTRLDGTQVVALDESGKLHRVQFRKGARPFLAAASTFAQNLKPSGGFSLAKGRVFVTDRQRGLLMLDATSWDVLAEKPLVQPAELAPMTAGNLTLVAAGNQLHAFQSDQKLAAAWQNPPKLTAYPVGAVSRPQGLAVVLQDGTVLLIDPATGAVKSTNQTLRQAVTYGPVEVGGQVWFGTQDGTLFPLDPFLAPPA